MDIEGLINASKGTNLVVTEDEKYDFIEKNQLAEYYVGDFNHLIDHKTLRRGKKHLLLGTTGSGKSTLARAIAFNIARKKKVMWYSSEEDSEDMKTAISFSNELPESLRNIEFREENIYLTKYKNDYKSFLNDIIKDFIENKCEAFFFDNLTTSAFYEGLKFEEQKDFFMKISNIFLDLNKPIYFIAHTDAKTKDLQAELFTANDIRGNKIPAMKCEYIYAYQIINWKAKDDTTSKFNLGADDTEKKAAFIRVLKSRQHGNGGNVYLLDFDKDKKKYKGDKLISFEKFKEFYDLRLRLK